MATIHLTNTTKVAVVDAADVEMLSGHTWRLHPKGYATTAIYNRELKRQQTWFMHRLLMGCSIGDGKLVDHKNRDVLDNRRENLRFVTASQSLRNRGKIRQKNVGVPFKGVHQRNGKFVAAVHLGTFDTPEAAALAFDEATRILYPGMGYPVNFPEESENSV